MYLLYIVTGERHRCICSPVTCAIVQVEITLKRTASGDHNLSDNFLHGRFSHQFVAYYCTAAQSDDAIARNYLESGSDGEDNLRDWRNSGSNINVAPLVLK